METLPYIYSLSQIRELYAECKKECVDFRDFINHIDGDYANGLLILTSIKDGLCTFDEVEKDDIIEDSTGLYSREYYVMTREGDIEHSDDANYCEHDQEYTTENLSECYIGRNTEYWSERAIDRGGLEYYNGTYYDQDALGRHNLVIMSNGEIEHQDNVYYWESDNEYHYESEPCDTYTRDYHN
jgi:hypothetical protein